MLFTSYEFIGFLLCLFLLYYLIPHRYQWILLLLSDFVFYACAGISGLLFMGVTILTSWKATNAIRNSLEAQTAYLKSDEGRQLSRDDRKLYRKKCEKIRKRWLLAALFIDIGILAVLKYTNFVLANVGTLFHFSAHVDWLLPMGISFYTFQTVGYVIDVYWEKVPAERNLAKTALFTSFFPLLIQGPICRFGDMKDGLFSEHKADFRNMCFALMRILWGYFKKIVIADRLVPAVTTICGNPDTYDGAFAFFGALLYAAELYADFTGGIDITIGIAQFFGIPVTENFQRPFFSRNIAEYWRRWHITMGTWFKDYIFYPLSVSAWMMHFTKKVRSKCGDSVGRKAPVYLATLITWFLTGLWHGAAWNFIVWGLLNAVIILLAEELKPVSNRLVQKYPGLADSRPIAVLEILRTFLLMCALRMLDCYRNVSVSFRAFFSIFSGKNWSECMNGGLLNVGLSQSDYAVVGIGILLMFAVSLFEEKKGSVRDALSRKPVLFAICTVVLLLTILVFGAYGIGYDASQFIYNQF